MKLDIVLNWSPSAIPVIYLDLLNDLKRDSNASKRGWAEGLPGYSIALPLLCFGCLWRQNASRDPRVTSKPCLCFMLLWMWIDAVYGMGLVLPHKKMECNSVCNPSTHLDDAGTAWKSNGLAWNLCQQVSCKGNDHLLVTLERGIHKIKHESAHSM